MRRVSKSKVSTVTFVEKTVPKRNASPNTSPSESDAKEEGEVKSLNLNPAQSSNGNNKAVSSLILEDESDEAESFEVQSILGSRVRHGKRQFKIRWKGYGPADDSWEDEENVESPDLIAAYLKGSSDNEDVPKLAQKSPKTPKSSKKAATKRSATPKTAVGKKAKTVKGDDNTDYEVSKIIDYVALKDGTRQFYVQWKGFSSKDNTWEPESNLSCPDLIEKYFALEKMREDSTRETREVRKPVHKFANELTKRSSHRTSTKKSGGVGDLDDSRHIMRYSYRQHQDSSFSSDARYEHLSPRVHSRSTSSFTAHDNPWYSQLTSSVSSKCTLM